MDFSTPLPILVFLIKTCQFNKTAFPKEVLFSQRKSFCCQILCYSIFRGNNFYLFTRNSFPFWNVTIYWRKKKTLICSRFFCHENCKYLNTYQGKKKKRKEKRIFKNPLLKQEQAVLELQRGRVRRALAVFNPSLWEWGHHRLSSTWSSCWLCWHRLWLLEAGTGTSPLPGTLLEYPAPTHQTLGEENPSSTSGAGWERAQPGWSWMWPAELQDF